MPRHAGGMVVPASGRGRPGRGAQALQLLPRAVRVPRVRRVRGGRVLGRRRPQPPADPAPASPPGGRTVTSSARRRGSAWERAVASYLRDHGHPYAERAYGAGRHDDRGDLLGFPGWVLECKSRQRLELADWIEQAESARARAGADYAAVIVKRRQRPTGSAYVVMRLDHFARLLAELDGRGPDD